MSEADEITRQLLRYSPDALVVVDAGGIIRFANETVRDLLGYEPGDLTGKPIEVLVPERLRQRHGSYVANFLRAPRNREMGVTVADLAAQRADGSEFPAAIRLAHFHVGESLLVAAAIRDMTERRRINAALVLAREEADRANRAKSRFLASASHDLRQPLQTVRLLNASMLRMVNDTDVGALLRRQEQAIDSMTRLLNGLLDVSRLESGAIELQLVDVRLDDLLDELRQQFEPIVRARGISLYVTAENVGLRTDRTLFTQLLENLLGNALKYTDRGSVSLTGTLQSDALHLDIEDTGIGIPQEKVEHIFDEYYQVDSSGTRRAGVGLGLAIVREVSRLLGYTVAVYSQVGVGTRVRVSIPRDMLVARDAVADPQAARHAARSASRPRLILIEDNEGVRVATELFLQLEGFEVTSAGSAGEAQQLLESMRGDELLVVDYHLEGSRTGLELVSGVRQRRGVEIPAVVLSGDLPSVLRVQKTPIPRCRFLSKPVDTEALLQAISELATG
ncbi:ATP-binding protein [Povalibacter sp.]|uniref:hybrid sensor histidine kinase/response regulator n=1 Tax=Povalibacter sp. TaxID=1962978 RepID=UPI002F3E23D8